MYKHTAEETKAYRESVARQRREQLRDQFAMAALQGEVANQDYEAGYMWAGAERTRQLAKRCYEIADAMLAAREAGR